MIFQEQAEQDVDSSRYLMYKASEVSVRWFADTPCDPQITFMLTLFQKHLENILLFLLDYREICFF